MPSFLKEARAFINSTGIPCIEVKYIKYTNDDKYTVIPVLFETRPLHGWKELRVEGRQFRYDEFLNNMIEKNLEVIFLRPIFRNSPVLVKSITQLIVPIEGQLILINSCVLIPQL